MVEAKEVNFSFYITEKCFTLIGEAGVDGFEPPTLCL